MTQACLKFIGPTLVVHSVLGVLYCLFGPDAYTALPGEVNINQISVKQSIILQ